MTNCLATEFTDPGPHAPSPTSCNMLTAAERRREQQPVPMLELIQRPSHRGVRTVANLVNMVAASVWQVAHGAGI